jgi:hypothetical protein
MPMTEAQDLAWIANRVPGDPKYIRKLWEGRVAIPAPVTARDRWEARQVERVACFQQRARMFLTSLIRCCSILARNVGRGR